MSGATFIAVLLRAPQLASGLTCPSVALASMMMSGVVPAMPPRPPAPPPATEPPLPAVPPAPPTPPVC